MFKIKVSPKISNFEIFNQKIDENKLYGSLYYEHNNKYNLFRNITHCVKDIFLDGEDMYGLIEINNSEKGRKIKNLINLIGENNFLLKEFYINDDNLGLNIYMSDINRNLSL